MTKEKRSKKRRLTRADRIFLSLAILLLIASGGMIGYASLMSWTPLSEVDGDGSTIVGIDEELKTESDNKGKVVNFLIVGIDYTETDSAAGLNRGKLTDVIMVASFNMQDGKVAILQIPRDTYIGSEYPTGKINAVYNNANAGGINNLARVIYDRFRIPIDHYITITMDGFVNAIDAIGGIEINVTESFTLEGVTFRPGVQTLDGYQTSKFVRERYSRQGGDIGRMQAQQQVLSAIFKKFTSLSTSDITSLVPTLLSEVTTDMTVKNILDIGLEALKLSAENITFHIVPGESCSVNGLSVWTVHKEVLAEILNTYFRPFDDPVPAEELNIIEVKNSVDYYDDLTTGVDDYIE